MKLTEQEFQQLLLEEQYVARLSQTLQMQFNATQQILKSDKYNVQANTNLPKIKADMKEVMGLSASLSKTIVECLASKYQLSLPYLIRIEKSEPTKLIVND